MIDPALTGRLRVGIVAAGLPLAQPLGERAAVYILTPRATVRATAYPAAANDVATALTLPRAQSVVATPAAAAIMVSVSVDGIIACASATGASAKRVFAKPESIPHTEEPLLILTHDLTAMADKGAEEMAGAGIARQARPFSLADRIFGATRDLKRRLGRRLKLTSDRAAPPTSAMFYVTKAFALTRH
ncbi:hypothetical protein ACVWZA_003900 [Sphingomonas sp. UYAg733]